MESGSIEILPPAVLSREQISAVQYVLGEIYNIDREEYVAEDGSVNFYVDEIREDLLPQAITDIGDILGEKYSVTWTEVDHNDPPSKISVIVINLR